MDISQLTPKQKKFWRFLVAETKYMEYSYFGDQVNMDAAIKTKRDGPRYKNLSYREIYLSNYYRKVKTGLTKLLSDNSENSLIFVIELLDEPLPSVWPIILESIQNIDHQIVIDTLREFSELENRIINPLAMNIRLYDPQNKNNNPSHLPEILREQDLRQTASLMLKDKSIFPTSSVLNSSDVKYLESIMNDFTVKEWYPTFYQKFRRNLDFYLDIWRMKREGKSVSEREQIGRPISLELDSKIMKPLVYWLGIHANSDLDPKILNYLMEFYLFNPSNNHFRDYTSVEAPSNVFKSRKWDIDYILEFVLDQILNSAQLNLNENGELVDKYGDNKEQDPRFLDFFNEVKNQIVEQAELKDLIKIYSKLTNPISSSGLPDKILANDPKKRAMITSITADIGNKLVKQDIGMVETVESLFGYTVHGKIDGSLNKVIVERRCCEMHGRNGDKFCNVCGRVIPDEMIVS